MFQLKMYMAISGRAPERGLPAHRRQLPTPTPAPPVQSVSAVHALPPIFEREEPPPPPLAASSCHLRGLEHRSVGQYGTKQPFWDQRPLAPSHHPVPLPPCTLPSVGGSRCRRAGCQFHFPTPFYVNSCHFLYLLGNGVVGAKCKAKLLSTLTRSPPLTQHLSLVPSHLTVLYDFHIPGQAGMDVRSQDPDIPRKTGYGCRQRSCPTHPELEAFPSVRVWSLQHPFLTLSLPGEKGSWAVRQQG